MSEAERVPGPLPEGATTAPAAVTPRVTVTVGEVVNAWQRSGRRAAALQQKLELVSSVSRQRYEELTRLARVTRKRRQQNERLQAKLVSVLERQSKQPVPAPAEDQILSQIETEGSDQDQIPLHYARVLLKRLRESQKIVEEYDTLLQLRERQVQEMLPSFREHKTVVSDDFVVAQLQQELDQMRHRVRLLTAELVYPVGNPAPQSSSAGEDSRVLELQARVQQLQSELASSPMEADPDVMTEFTLLQDEVSRLQDEVLRLQEENEELRAGASEPAADAQADRVAQAEKFFNQLVAQLTEENNELRRQLESAGTPASASPELEPLRAEIQQLQQQLAAAPDRDRMTRLEAAVTDLRGKLQLAASKYQEVKEALLKKHKQLQELQSRSVETEQQSDFTVSVVQTLESALSEAKRQAESRQVELDQARQQLVESQKRLSEKDEHHSSEGPSDPGSLEAKLKEARRSAVRAQAEAGLKRKEASKLQEEVEALKARLAAAGL